MHQESKEQTINLLSLFKALSDPIRLKIVRELILDKKGAERHCSTFELSVTKATRSHHFKVLREAGLINVIDKGNYAVAILRWDELEKAIPGLINALAGASFSN